MEQSPGTGRGEDVRVWVGRVLPGHRPEHEQHVEWLSSAQAQEIFRRRRLTEYLLAEQDDTVTVIFKAPRTGDPRIMIDFLRYPGVWPEFWEFQRGGVDAEVPAQARVRVHWQREESDTARSATVEDS